MGPRVASSLQARHQQRQVLPKLALMAELCFYILYCSILLEGCGTPARVCGRSHLVWAIAERWRGRARGSCGKGGIAHVGCVLNHLFHTPHARAHDSAPRARTPRAARTGPLLQRGTARSHYPPAVAGAPSPGKAQRPDIGRAGLWPGCAQHRRSGVVLYPSQASSTEYNPYGGAGRMLGTARRSCNVRPRLPDGGNRRTMHGWSLSCEHACVCAGTADACRRAHYVRESLGGWRHAPERASS